VIKTTTRFEVTDGKYDWLRSGVFVGSLEAGAGTSASESESETEIPTVCIKIYKLK
jgi:hypothetical protein